MLKLILISVLPLSASLPSALAQAPKEASQEVIFEVLIAQSRTGDRINIAIFNPNANNVQAITSYRQAESLGDLAIKFDRGGKTFTWSVPGEYTATPESIGAQWIPRGNGFGWTLPNSLARARYALIPGCYEMTVSYKNAAAWRLSPARLRGPQSLPAISQARVCVE